MTPIFHEAATFMLLSFLPCFRITNKLIFYRLINYGFNGIRTFIADARAPVVAMQKILEKF